MIRRLPPQDPPEPDRYFQVDLDPKLRFVLLDLIRGVGKGPSSDVLRALETAVVGAREMDLPRGEMLEWSEVEDEAARQGVGVVDIIWDRRATPDTREE